MNIKSSLLALAALAGAMPLFAEGRTELSVTLTEAGTLNTFVTVDDVPTLKKLTVAGPLNGTDLRLIRSLTGLDERWKPTQGVLTDIDFTDATFVAGGENICVPHGMEDVENPEWIKAREDAMPEELFSATKLETVKLPKSVKKIYSTFADATNLAGEIVVPEGIQIIGEWAFSNTAITKITLPSTLKDEVANPTFNQRALGAHAFQNCGKLESITLPAGVTRLYDSTFEGCTSLKTFTVPATLTRIGGKQFMNSGVIDLICESKTPAKAEYEAFRGMDFDNCIVHVPEGAIAAYRQAEEWCDFVNIVDPSHEIAEVVVTTIPTVVDSETVGELYVVSDGEMTNRIELPLGQTVTFDALPAAGYELDYVTRVTDGSDDSVNVGDSYTAVREDVTKGVIFKGVFKKKQGGIDSIDADNTPAEYFDLQGRRIDRPASGIVIERRGNTASKVIL